MRALEALGMGGDYQTTRGPREKARSAGGGGARGRCGDIEAWGRKKYTRLSATVGKDGGRRATSIYQSAVLLEAHPFATVHAISAAAGTSWRVMRGDNASSNARTP